MKWNSKRSKEWAPSLVLSFIFITTLIVLSGCAGSRVVSQDRRGILDQPQAGSERGPHARRSKSAPASLREFRWPLQEIEFNSHFGQRGQDFHEGVDLKASTGTRVYAAQGGRVIYADSKIRGYGKLVIIKHNDGLSTVYAHNSKILVRKDSVVRRGQWIALSGNTGHSTGPHLHFELRHGVDAVDPESYMPMPAKLFAAKPAVKSMPSRPLVQTKRVRSYDHVRQTQAQAKRKSVHVRKPLRAPAKKAAHPKSAPRKMAQKGSKRKKSRAGSIKKIAKTSTKNRG